MSVKINIPSGLRHFIDGREVVEVEGRTVGECVDQLIGRFPVLRDELLDKEGKVLNFVDIYVNGKSSYPEELEKPVKDDDKIHILRAIGGG